jgi:hypothetical protein
MYDGFFLLLFLVNNENNFDVNSVFNCLNFVCLLELELLENYYLSIFLAYVSNLVVSFICLVILYGGEVNVVLH